MSNPAALSRHYGTTSPDKVWDYVVIGSGMGGMTTASLLSKSGKQVLMLEQHYVPGGMTHTFKRHGWRWDVGVHAVGEVSEDLFTGRLLHFLTDGELHWSSLGDVYDTFEFPGGFKIGFPDNEARFIDAVTAAFPAEADGIRRYMQLAADATLRVNLHYASQALPNWLSGLVRRLGPFNAERLFNTTARDVLDSCLTDERLKTILAGQWGYHGLPPSQAAFGVHALVTTHFFSGAYYPLGGSQRIADTLLRAIAAAGGCTRVRADVQQIVVERGRVAGVRLAGGEQIRARRVISAAGAPATMRLLPPEHRGAPWATAIEALAPSPAYICLNLGFKGDIAHAGATAANQWFYETWSAEVDHWDLQDAQAEAPVLYVSFPSLKNPSHDAGPEQLHTGEVVTFVPYDAFVKWRDSRWRKRGDDYEALKKEMVDRLLRQFFRYRPDLKPMLAFAELSTPLSTEHFCRANKGAIYGLAPSGERFANPFLRPKTPVRGLFLAGGDVTSGGVMGAFGGGLIAAMAAEPMAIFRLLRPLLFARGSAKPTTLHRDSVAPAGTLAETPVATVPPGRLAAERP